MARRATAETAWCLYDWGNSAFATVCMTAVLPPILVGLVDGELGRPHGTATWGWIAAAGLLVGVVFGPPLGAFADARGRRRRLLAVVAATGCVATAALAVVLPGSWRLGAAAYVVAASCFATANVFYDSLLPVVAPLGRIDEVSARGYAYGYVGGGLLLAVAATLVLRGGAGLAASFVAVAVWWGVFTVPVVVMVPEPAPVASWRWHERLRRTLREAKSRPQLWRFLLAYWLYNDGIGTIIKMAAAYGAELRVPLPHMLGALILTQFVGAPATVAFGRLGARLGAKAGIQIALVGYAAITTLALFLSQVWHFWVLAALVGLVQGGAQALSRSLYCRLIPAGREAEYFSFFDVSGRMAGIAGPVLFSLLTLSFGSGRAGVVAVAALFVAGAWVLAGVEVTDAREATTP